MALTNSVVIVSQYLVDKLNDNKANLGLQAVYYGDQTKIPYTPTVCIEPVEKNNELRQGGMARYIDMEFMINIILYHSSIQSEQSNRKEADLFAEAIESVIHADRALGSVAAGNNLVTHGYITKLESGYATKQGTLMRSARMTYAAISQNVLPS